MAAVPAAHVVVVVQSQYVLTARGAFFLVSPPPLPAGRMYSPHLDLSTQGRVDLRRLGHHRVGRQLVQPHLVPQLLVGHLVEELALAVLEVTVPGDLSAAL